MAGLPEQIIGRAHDHADAAHSLGLLCAGTQRPRCRAAQQRDELTPFQVNELHTRTLSQ
jgi:hypothetical protein